MLLTKKVSRLMALLVLLMGIITVACTASGSGESEPAMEDMDHSHDAAMEEMDHDHGDEHSDRIPNPNGAAVHIIAPADGATFSASDEVLVEVSVENFELGVDGSHWHVYVDGSSWGMVTGGNTDQPLTGLEPGEHMIEVFLSIPTHEEMEQGDSIMINIAE